MWRILVGIARCAENISKCGQVGNHVCGEYKQM